MKSFDRELTKRLDSLRQQGLYRELHRIDSAQSPRIKIGGKAFRNFSSNDYLGLANDPVLKEAAIRAVERFGAGAGASRLVSGSLEPHHELEEAIATFKKVEAALSFATGYAAAMGAICALMGKQDVIVSDEFVHASIVDAARLTDAKIRIFKHNDLNALEDALKVAAKELQSPKSKVQRDKRRVLVVTESVFSMDGDRAPLREIVELKEKYGAWLLVDEAHATGLYGRNRRGLAEELEVADRIDVQMGTLGKALGAAGGFICGSRPLVDYLINRARSFIFSTAPAPAAAASATAAIRLVQSPAGEERRRTLWQRVRQLREPRALKDSTVAAKASDMGGSASERAAIIPIMVGDETQAVELATALRRKRIYIPAIRYPSVPRGSARLRLTLTAAHTPADVEHLRTALEDLGHATTHHELCAHGSIR